MSPDGILSMGELEQRIETAGRKLGELLDEVRDAAEDAAVSEAALKTAFAQARLRARAEHDGRRITVDEVDDLATAETSEGRLTYLIAANRLTVAREAMRARQAQLDALRTLVATARSAGA